MLELLPERMDGQESDESDGEDDDVCCVTCADRWWYAWLHLLRMTLAISFTFALVHFPSVAFLHKFMLGDKTKVPWWHISPLLLPVDVLFFLAIGLCCWVYRRTRQPIPILVLTLVSCMSLWMLGSVCMRPLGRWNSTEIWSFWASATALKLIGLAISIGPVSWLLLDRWATVRRSDSPFAPMTIIVAIDRMVLVRERALFQLPSSSSSS